MKKIILALICSLICCTALAQDDLITKVNLRNKRVESIYTKIETVARVKLTVTTNEGILAFERPDKFRVVTNNTVHKTRMVDMGMNGDQAVWCYVYRIKPPTCYYGTLKDVNSLQGNASMLDPRIMLEGLGLGLIENAKRFNYKGEAVYQRVGQKTNGDPIAYLTTVHPDLQLITGYLVYDKNKNLILSSKITKHFDSFGIPKQAEVEWPDQRMRITWTLSDLKVNEKLPDKLWQLPKYDRMRPFSEAQPDGVIVDEHQ